MNKKHEIKKPLDYFTYNEYAEYMKAAEHFLTMAQDHKLGQRWNLLGSVVFSVFSIESFINHVGAKQCVLWKKWDEKNRPNTEEKLKKLNVILDNSLKSQFTELIQLRNKIAHGRTEEADKNKNVRKPQNNLIGAMNYLSSDLETRTTLPKVRKLVLNAKNIIEFIYNNTPNLTNHKLWSIGSGSLRISEPNE